MVDVGYDNDILLRLSNSCDSNEARAKLLEKASLLEARMTGRLPGDSDSRPTTRTGFEADAPGVSYYATDDEDDEDDVGTVSGFAMQSHEPGAKKRRVFSREEDDAILEGVKKHGLDWDRVATECGPARTPKQVQSRYRRLQKQRQSGAQGVVSPGAADAETACSPGGSALGAKVGDAAKIRSNTISRYFAKMDDEPNQNPSPRPAGPPGSVAVAAAAALSNAGTPPPAARGGGGTAGPQQGREAEVQTEVGLGEAAEALEAASKLPALASELAAARERLVSVQRQAEENARGKGRAEKQLEEVSKRAEAREAAGRQLLADLAVEGARREREEKRAWTQQQGMRLGTVGVQRAGAHLTEVWEEGSAQRELAERTRLVQEQRDAVEGARKALKRRLPPPGSSPGAAEASNGMYVTSEEYQTREEAFKVRCLALRREEESISKERERVEAEKQRYIRELKRMKDEEASRFNGHQVMNGRYVLLNLLGRGGFSEVFKAVDLKEQRLVACKIHQLNSQWREAKKQSYVRHAVREYNIHRALRHPRVVRLHDTFEVDQDTFCTVLEYCGGEDLDAHLKRTQSLPEREARCIVSQILDGLSYLNSAGRRIIHYDLKPGNILFDETGGVKITDFGLSKIMEESVATQDGMELTSQGAGTYWYLPPECFEVGHAPPKVSSKVDVWSVGVIMFQLLYGRRPFGHDLTQEKILREEAILRANAVEFPAKPAVSAEAKEFIRRLLAPRQEERLDVHAARSDPYLALAKPKSKGAGN